MTLINDVAKQGPVESIPQEPTEISRQYPRLLRLAWARGPFTDRPPFSCMRERDQTKRPEQRHPHQCRCYGFRVVIVLEAKTRLYSMFVRNGL